MFLQKSISDLNICRGSGDYKYREKIINQHKKMFTTRNHKVLSLFSQTNDNFEKFSKPNQEIKPEKSKQQ